jgi:iron(III) transport system ATP-binding protein
MSAIQLHSVAKDFGAGPVLAGVEMTVPAGSVTAVLGASGSGKTTLLRLIAGFEPVTSGTIVIGDQTVDDGRRLVRPQHRGVGYVPQDGALFPHLTVVGNVSFGLSRRDRSQAEALLDQVGLRGLAARYPHQLSGGEQQRVALARALAIQPSVVLLDEPFNALDAALRTELAREVIRILRDSATTTVLVTHDQSEALALADRVAVLEGGRIVALGDPRTLYGSPADVVAATSIGAANVLTAEFDGNQARCTLGTVRLASPAPPTADGRARLLLRPEQLTLHLDPRADAIPAKIDRLYYQGHEALAYLRPDDQRDQLLLARVPGEFAAVPGQAVWVQVTGAGRVLPAE